MSETYFFTGFPGFIATQLITEIIRSKHEETVHFNLLVLPDMVTKAEKNSHDIATALNISTDVFSVITGDITQEGLGIDPAMSQKLIDGVTHVFHLAAIYDLAVPEELANKVNIIGTDQVNRWVLKLVQLKRYVYFSTAYVAGRREGRIYETELECGQSFKNHYERTKYEAEVLVDRLKSDVPVTIIRPGIVVGHSTSGDTVKFDGPYFILNFIERLKWFPVFPYLGNGEAEGNFVPIDFIIQATIYLAHVEKGIGKTYHLADPKPYKTKEIYRLMLQSHLGKNPKGAIPLSFAKALLSSSNIRKWLGVEKEALDYFECRSEYDCTLAQKDLEGSGIVCPDFKDVLKTMVRFYDQHKHDKVKQIKIR